jgi:hypothetical protein
LYETHYQAAFFSIYFFYRSRWRTIHVGIKLRGILSLSIYDKILTKPDFPSGVIINLFASDAQTLTELLPNIVPGIVAPFQILAVIGMSVCFVRFRFFSFRFISFRFV